MRTPNTPSQTRNGGTGKTSPMPEGGYTVSGRIHQILEIIQCPAASLEGQQEFLPTRLPLECVSKVDMSVV
jgi:hypothetical protein